MALIHSCVCAYVCVCFFSLLRRYIYRTYTDSNNMESTVFAVSFCFRFVFFFFLPCLHVCAPSLNNVFFCVCLGALLFFGPRAFFLLNFCSALLCEDITKSRTYGDCFCCFA